MLTTGEFMDRWIATHCPTCRMGQLEAVGASTAADAARADDEGRVKCSLGCGSFTEEELAEAAKA